jgi:hypothetical protein
MPVKRKQLLIAIWKEKSDLKVWNSFWWLSDRIHRPFRLMDLVIFFRDGVFYWSIFLEFMKWSDFLWRFGRWLDGSGLDCERWALSRVLLYFYFFERTAKSRLLSSNSSKFDVPTPILALSIGIEQENRYCDSKSIGNSIEVLIPKTILLNSSWVTCHVEY